MPLFLVFRCDLCNRIGYAGRSFVRIIENEYITGKWTRRYGTYTLFRGEFRFYDFFEGFASAKSFDAIAAPSLYGQMNRLYQGVLLSPPHPTFSRG